jgi:hypothetical protein
VITDPGRPRGVRPTTATPRPLAPTRLRSRANHAACRGALLVLPSRCFPGGKCEHSAPRAATGGSSGPDLREAGRSLLRRRSCPTS